MKKITPGRCSRSTLHSEAGEAELKLSAEGNWQLQIRRADEREWRIACSGDLAVGGAPVVHGEPLPDPVRLGKVIVDPAARRVTVDGDELALGTKEFDLLAILAAEPNRVFSKAELLRLAFGHETEIRTRTLDSHASRLRVKLREAGAGELVVNCRGVGYKLWRGAELAVAQRPVAA